MNKKKILVTGANGYLGQGVVKKLLDKGYLVIATDFKIDQIDERAKRIQINLFDVENPYVFFEKPDILLHLAWRDGFVHYSENHLNDLPMHYKFIKAMMESDIELISVMGSMHEIGFWEGAINENTPCKPLSLYGIGKNALREVVQMFSKQYNKKIQWLRGYYIVGNTEYGSSVFSKITKSESEGKKVFPFTTGQNQYDFIDYDVFCEQVSTTIIQDEVLGIINICSGKPEKLSERVERFIDENNYKIKLDYGAFPERPYDSKAVWGDSEKIEKIMLKRNEKN